MKLSDIPNSIMIFGNTNFRGACPAEAAEQISFLSLLRRDYPELADIAIHARNEGKRTKLQGHQHKLEGMNTGASDIIIPTLVPIVMELKRADHTKSSISTDQIRYLVLSARKGAFSCIALGTGGAIDAIAHWKKFHERTS